MAGYLYALSRSSRRAANAGPCRATSAPDSPTLRHHGLSLCPNHRAAGCSQCCPPPAPFQAERFRDSRAWRFIFRIVAFCKPSTPPSAWLRSSQGESAPDTQRRSAWNKEQTLLPHFAVSEPKPWPWEAAALLIRTGPGAHGSEIKK